MRIGKWMVAAFVLMLLPLSACIGEEVDFEDETSDIGFTFEGLTTNGVLSRRGGTTRIVVPLNPGTNDLIMDSWVAGRWRFRTWNTKLGTNSCLSVGGYPPEVDTVVFTYWKDSSNPRDTWHEWPGGGLVCRLAMFSTILNSGSPNISYKLSYDHYGSYSTTVTAEFTKL